MTLGIFLSKRGLSAAMSSEIVASRMSFSGMVFFSTAPLCDSAIPE